MLVGRGLELELVSALLTRERPLVVVTGEAGIGKTSLVRAAVARAARPVFEGGAFATLSWLPFLPFVRALGAEAGEGDTAYAVDVAVRRVGPDGILFLDDLQWADSSTLEAVAGLRGRIPLVAAVRSGTDGAEAALTAVEGAEQIELEHLGEADAHELVRAQAPGLDHGSAQRIVRAAGGNPLLLEELAVGDGVSDSLRLALEARLRALPVASLHAMSMLSLAGRPLERRLVDGGDDLVAAGLAVADGNALRPRHALLAETASDMLDDAERERVHALLADVVPTIGERARHLAAAGRTEAASATARRAADEAPTPGERVAHLELAARCAAPGGGIALRLEAAEEMVQALMMRELSALLDSLDAPDAQSQARVELHRSMLALDLGDPESAERAVDEGLALIGGTGSSTEGLLLSRKGILEKVLHNNPVRSIELVRAGAELTDERDRPRALSTLAWMLSEADTESENEWIDVFVAAIAAAQAVGNASVELMARNNLCGCLAGSLTPLEARPHIDSAIARARELRLLDWERMMRWQAATLDLKEGRYDRVLDGCADVLDEPLQEHLRSLLLLTRAEACIAVGRFDEAASAFSAMETLDGVRPYNVGRGRMLRADLELTSGRPRPAVERADTLLAEQRSEHAYLRIEIGLIRAWACFDLDESVEEITDLPVMGEDGLRKDEIRTLARARTEPGEASRELTAHAEAWREVSRRDELRCRWAAGELARRAGDAPAARALLLAAEERCDALGLAPLLGRVRRSLRLLGDHRGATRAAAGVLTAREREILDLVGQGLTNPEIARRLATSVPTVARQIATASRKLGAATRAQAAVLAARR